MVKIEMDATDALRVLNALGSLPMPQVMRQVGEVAAQLTRERFRSGSEPDGAQWLPLKPKTLEARRRRGNFSVAPLVDTGALFGSIRSEATASEAVVTIGGPGMWPATHQSGLPPIPARPFIPEGNDLPPSYIPALLAPIEAAIERALK